MPPNKVVKGFLDSMIATDYEEAIKVVQGADTDTLDDILEEDGSEEIIDAILNRVTYQIGEQEVSGNSATVAVKITAPDLLRITTQGLSEIMSIALAAAFSEEGSTEEEMNALFVQYFENAIKDPGAPMVESDIKIKLEKENSKWMIVPDEELAHALTGNIMKAFAEIGG